MPQDYCKKCADITVTEIVMERLKTLIISLETANSMDNPEIMMDYIMPPVNQDVLCRPICKSTCGKRLKDLKLINSTAFLFESVALKYYFPIVPVAKCDQLLLYDLCIYKDKCKCPECYAVPIAIKAATSANPLNDNSNASVIPPNNTNICLKTQKILIQIGSAAAIEACVMITSNIKLNVSTIATFPAATTSYTISSTQILWSSLDTTMQTSFTNVGINGADNGTIFMNALPYDVTFSEHITISIPYTVQPGTIAISDGTVATLLDMDATKDSYYTYTAGELLIHTKSLGVIGITPASSVGSVITDYSNKNICDWIINLRSIMDSICSISDRV